MTYLYGRRAVVDVGNLRVDGLNISFTIEYEKLEFGKAEIKIFNLNSTNRKKIEESETSDVSLSVGYENTALDRIFKGVMRQSFSKRDGTDWVTTLKTGDGDKASQAMINRGYRANTSKSKIWKDLIASLGDAGVSTGNAITAFESGNFKDGVESVLSGMAVAGKSFEQLRKMARSKNLDVHVQDGELVVTQVGQPLDASAIVLSASTGLIGTPSKGIKGQANARALIIPGLRPKRLVQFDSDTLSGLYVVAKSKYKGEVRGNDWYVDLECVERK